MEFPEIPPDQVEALASRQGLFALLDDQVHLGPDQAAVRLGVRRAGFDHIARFGWLSPWARPPSPTGRGRGSGAVQLYSAAAVELAQQTSPSTAGCAARGCATDASDQPHPNAVQQNSPETDRGPIDPHGRPAPQPHPVIGPSGVCRDRWPSRSAIRAG